METGGTGEWLPKGPPTNQDLVFACRVLDWNGGKLVVPDQLRPLLESTQKIIIHDPDVMNQAMRPGLLLEEMASDSRLQIYRTALDSFLSWLCLVENALERGLFSPSDIKEVGYWVAHIKTVEFLEEFIHAFGYGPGIERLRNAFSFLANDYRDGRALSIARGGFGTSALPGGSAGG